MVNIITPGLNYRGMNRGDTNKVMQAEAAFYDAALDSDGSDATFDINIGTDDAPRLLTAPVIRGTPRAYVEQRNSGKPGEEPRHNYDIFAAKRTLLQYVDVLSGNSMLFEGLRYKIMYAKPHKVANVAYFIELHCSPDEGLQYPNRIQAVF